MDEMKGLLRKMQAELKKLKNKALNEKTYILSSVINNL